MDTDPPPSCTRLCAGVYGGLLEGMNSLRCYENNIKHLIDFQAKCLNGLNIKTRQELDLIKILQL